MSDRLRFCVLPGEAGLLGPQSEFPRRPAGFCTAPGPGPSPHALDWPGSRCEPPLQPCRAAATGNKKSIDRKKKGLLK